MPDDIRPIGEPNAQFARVQPVSPSSPPALVEPTAQRSLRPLQKVPAEPRPALLLDGDLVVEIDKEAGRFVQKILDPRTGDVLRQYPSEDQLKFSRALAAALRVVREA